MQNVKELSVKEMQQINGGGLGRKFIKKIATKIGYKAVDLLVGQI